MDAAHHNGFEADIEAAFAANSPFHDIAFSIPTFRYSEGGNFSGRVAYQHSNGAGRFELQISYRLDPILDSTDLTLADQPYFRYVEFPPPRLHGLDPYEMIGEKIMACNRRRGCRPRTSTTCSCGRSGHSTPTSSAASPCLRRGRTNAGHRCTSPRTSWPRSCRRTTAGRISRGWYPAISRRTPKRSAQRSERVSRSSRSAPTTSEHS